MPNFGSHLSGPVRHTTRQPDTSERGWFQDLPIGMNDPDFVHDFVDFKRVNDFNTTDWTTNSSASGGAVTVNTSSSAVATGASLPLVPVLMGANYGTTYSGALLIQSSTAATAAAGAYSTIQPKCLNWLLDTTIVSGLLGTGGHAAQTAKKMWWEAQFAVDLSGLDCNVFVGLSDTTINPVIGGQNLVGFKIVSGGNTINFISSTGGVTTSSTSFSATQSNPVQLINGSMTKVGFVFTGNGIQYYVGNGAGRNFIGQIGPGGFPTAPLSSTFQIQNTGTIGRAITLDYFYGCRVR